MNNCDAFLITKDMERIFILPMLLLVFGLSSCSTSSPKVVESDVGNYSIEAKKKILILPPIVSYELIDRSDNIPPGDPKIKEISAWINSLTVKQIQRIGFENELYTELNTSDKYTGKIIENLVNSSRKLTKTNPDKISLALFQGACNGNTINSFLFHYIRVKVGSDDEWKTLVGPFYFAHVPRTPQSSTYLRAVIRDCQSGAILWHNDVFLREMLSLNNVKFEEAVKRMYRNLSIERR